MPAAAELIMFQSPQQTSRGYRLAEQWEVYPTLNVGGARDPNGYIDAKQAIDPAIAIGLPAVGSVAASFHSVLCYDLRVQQVVSRTSIIVLASYSSYGLYSGGPREAVSSYGETRMIDLPIWRQITITTETSSNLGWEEVTGVKYPRMVIIRTETRWIGGNQVSAVQNAISANAGTLWPIGGFLYRLSDKSRVVFDGTTLTRADYRFELECRIPRIQVDAADTAFGNDIEIPELPALWLYRSSRSRISVSGSPVVKVVPPPAEPGGSVHVPPLPDLPGYP